MLDDKEEYLNTYLYYFKRRLKSWDLPCKLPLSVCLSINPICCTFEANLLACNGIENSCLSAQCFFFLDCAPHRSVTGDRLWIQEFFFLDPTQCEWLGVSSVRHRRQDCVALPCELGLSQCMSGVLVCKACAAAMWCVLVALEWLWDERSQRALILLCCVCEESRHNVSLSFWGTYFSLSTYWVSGEICF
jgi:hypothetical protein